MLVRSLAPLNAFSAAPAGEAAVFSTSAIAMNDQLDSIALPGEAAAASTAPAKAAPEPSKRESWRSEELLGDRPEVLILHNNEIYRLRRTRQGKLILHK